jgi:4-hydroxy-2-oxoheptanedioate aldolase
MLRNIIKDSLEKRGTAIGTWVQMRSPEICELAGASGFDFVIIDMEHGSFGLESAVEMVRAVQTSGAAPMIRLPGKSDEEIKKALDTGALGIVIPGIRTGVEATQVINAARYEPAGKRGACHLIRATMHGSIEWKKYNEWASRNTLVWILIENTDAVMNIDSILAGGVGAIMLGPFDLSVSMGLNGDIYHPKVTEALEGVTKAAVENGVEVIVPLFESEPDKLSELAQEWSKKKCRIFAALSDRSCLALQYRRTANKLKELAHPVQKG